MPDWENRFWSYVQKGSGDECWEWVGARIAAGYGEIMLSAKMYRAHRLSYEIVVGPIDLGLEVCHKCDNPACVRPDHLFLGTHKQNMQDMARKGRWGHSPNQAGENHGCAKLTWGQVREIRSNYAELHEPQRSIAARYGVTQTTILHIVHNKTWRE
jgi:hypothetical protein